MNSTSKIIDDGTLYATLIKAGRLDSLHPDDVEDSKKIFPGTKKKKLRFACSSCGEYKPMAGDHFL
ncbi:MAG: hypothetical protein OQK12_00315, partial [Motiliproteus sp.]|nr:hypothetical protein [Motiliproteus sp.]